jgi:hypothetical protein
MLRALDRVLRAVHRSGCATPQSVEIQRSDRAWIVTAEWEQPAKIGEWSLDMDTDRLTRGPCTVARRQQRRGGAQGFVRAIRAAVARAPRYQSAPERFQIGVAWLPALAAFQVDFFLGDHAVGGGEVVLVAGDSFHVIEAEPEP